MSLWRWSLRPTYLYRPETRELELTISHGYSKDLRGIRLALGEGLAGTIAQNKQPLIVDDYSHWVGRSPQWEEEQLKGALGVPLMRGDQLLGVLYLDRKRAGTFDERDLQLATLFANQAAIAIENARLYEDARKRIDELSGLYDISQAFSSMADVGETFGELTKRMAQLIGCQVCFIATYDQQAREMHAEPPGYGLSDELVRSLHYKVDGPARESWNFRLQGPLLANDITQIPGFFSWWTQHHGLFNLLIVPLSVESRITGLVYAANKPIGFTQDDTRFLTMFANQAAIVVENARLYDETQKRLAETTLLHKVAEIINATLDLKEIFRRVVEELSTAFGYRLVDIYLLEEDGLRLQANVGYDDKTTIELIPLERGVIGRVARTMEPAFVRDVSQDPDYIPAYSEIKSEICVPIRSGETLLGVLNVECDECRLLREDDLMLLDTLSSHIGVAIENARLYAKTQTHLKAMTTLQKIGAEITSSLDLSTLLQGIADSTLKLTNADYVHIFTLDPDSGEFNQRAASWQPKAKMPPITWPRKNKGLTAAVLKAQDPVIIERATDSPIYATPESRKWGVKSVAGFPLKGKWGLTGVLNMVFLQPHTFSKDELQLLALLADQGAIAIENARLYEETQKRLAETTVLHKVAEVINSTLDLKEVLQRVVEELSATFDYPLLGIYLLENGGLRLGAQIGYDLESESEFIPLDRGIVGRVARTGQPAFLRDVKEDPDYIPDDPKATGEICVPIKWGGEVLGVLNLESTGQRPLTEDDYQLLLTLSSHIGVAIENARLYEETKTLSITDGLTGLYNLRYFYEALEKEIARSGRYSRPLSLIILDIDGFKGYNDTYGHLAGDDLLKELARLMQKTTRNTDIVARYGGEEFVIIQPETGMEGAISLAHRIWDAVREHPFRIRQTQTVAKITISLGLATYPEHGTTAKELVQAADTALLRAKAAGKDRVCSYSEESA
jgi:diguanylate cyclase (GGDEF)-like protein